MPNRNAPLTLAALFMAALLTAGLVGCGGTGTGDTGESDSTDGAASAADDSGPQLPLLEGVKAEITVEAMDVELDSIVQYDRLSGSPGEIAAVNYLVRTLESEGIQVRVDTFLAYISDPVSASVQVPGTDFAPEAITVSGSGDVENLQAPMVDMGSLGDLPPFLTETGERFVLEARGPAGSQGFPPLPDLQGRIALVTGQPRPGPVTQLTLLGAAGVIFVNPEERLNDLTATSVWGTPSLRDYHRIPTLPVAQVKRSDGDRLRSMMADGTVEVRISTETRTGWKPLHLAVATIQGPTPDAPYVLAGGHLDAWYHGGTDNAGANVAMLELTRAFSRNQDRLRRGLVVAWWPGHSNGRYAGSTWFVDQRFDELRRRAVAYVNFEGLGQIDARNFGAAATTSFSTLARDVASEEVGEGIRPRPPGRNSDQSFNGVGLPLLQFNHSRGAEDGGYWWWHTPDDTRDKVDATVLKTDTDLYAAMLTRLLADPVFPVEPSATVSYLGDLLTDRQDEGGHLLDLKEAMARQKELARTVDRLETLLPEKGSPEIDLALIALLRPLHRILYTNLGPYHPDPAESVGYLPGLSAMEMLVANEPDTDAYQFALATVQREYARILEALDEAQAQAAALVALITGE